MKLVCTTDCTLFLYGNEVKECKEGSTYDFTDEVGAKLLSMNRRKFLTPEQYKLLGEQRDREATKRYEEGKKPRTAPKAPNKED